LNQYKVICPLINFGILNIVRPKELNDKENTKLLQAQERELAEGINLFDEITVRRISNQDLLTLEAYNDAKRGIKFMQSDKEVYT
jgi:hypothetical protein